MVRGKKDAFIKEGTFKCKCGREFISSQSFYAHLSHCEVYLGYKPKDRFGDARAWSRGKTKNDPVYGESIRKFYEVSSHNKGKKIVIHDRSKFERQSETRKKRYLSGELVPAPGVGRGKYSYLYYNGKFIMLRSTYEFIYALYLLYNNIEFEYESVRVSDENRSYISDFLIDKNHIIEIKGNYNASTKNQKKAFEDAGYTYEVKFWKDISECYEFLKSKLDIDDILSKIHEGHNSRNYYKHYFN